MRLLVRCEAQHPRRAGPSNVIGPYGGTGRRASYEDPGEDRREGEFRDAAKLCLR